MSDSSREAGSATDMPIGMRHPIAQILSRDACYCRDDHTVDEVVEMMQAARIRRLPVIDANRHLVGIVSLGDIAVKGSEELVSEALEGISHPAHPAHPTRTALTSAEDPAR